MLIVHLTSNMLRELILSLCVQNNKKVLRRKLTQLALVTELFTLTDAPERECKSIFVEVRLTQQN